MKATLKKCTSQQDSTNACVQWDQNSDSFYTVFSDIIDNAALTGFVKTVFHNKGNRMRNRYFEC